MLLDSLTDIYFKSFNLHSVYFGPLSLFLNLRGFLNNRDKYSNDSFFRVGENALDMDTIQVIAEVLQQSDCFTHLG